MATRKTFALVWLLTLCWSCVQQAPSSLGDRTGPKLLGVRPRSGVISPSDPVELSFSEALDERSVSAESIFIIPFRAEGACTVDLDCEPPARCSVGSCQRSLLDRHWLADARSPPLSARRRAQVAEVMITVAGDGDRVLLQPVRPLPALRRVDLLISEGVMDRSGNRLELGSVAGGGVRRFLLTTAVSDARPTLTLLSPKDRQTGIPTNLARVVVGFSKPVVAVGPAGLWLSVAGRRPPVRVLASPARCGDRSPGTCAVLHLLAPLPPLSEVSLRGEPSIRDAMGRALLAHAPLRFATASAEDHLAPRLVRPAVFSVADGCAIARLTSDEDVDVTLRASWRSSPLAVSFGKSHELGFRLGVDTPDRGFLALELTDLAGNHRGLRSAELALLPRPRVVISEVLANPAGSEPAQEYVELRNLSTSAVSLDGWTIDDGDDGVGVATLPAVVFPPGAYALVVGARYRQPRVDPAPRPGALILRLAQTLGDKGLANAGESIVLRDASGQVVSSFGGWADLAKRAGNGVAMVRVDPRGCDLASNWAVDSGGASTPGWSR